MKEILINITELKNVMAKRSKKTDKLLKTQKKKKKEKVAYEFMCVIVLFPCLFIASFHILISLNIFIIFSTSGVGEKFALRQISRSKNGCMNVGILFGQAFKLQSLSDLPKK